MHVLAYIYGLAYYAVLSLTFLPSSVLRAALTALLPGDALGCTNPLAATNCPANLAGNGDGRCGGACGSPEGAGFCGADSGHIGGGASWGAPTPAVAWGFARGAAAALSTDMALALVRSILQFWQCRLASCVYFTVYIFQKTRTHLPPQCMQGVSIVMIGQLLQCHSHLILASLTATPSPSTHAPHASDPSHRADASADGASDEAQGALRRRASQAAEAPETHAHAPAPAQAPEAAAQPQHYVVPRGGAFEWVSCPHYLGEIVIYCGFCVAQRGAPFATLVLMWVVRCYPRRSVSFHGIPPVLDHTVWVAGMWLAAGFMPCVEQKFALRSSV